jgi:L-histidine N-alpha-methyltransferase
MINALRSGLNEKRILFLNLLEVDHRKELLRDIRTGLTKPQKSIPSKYLYDSYGSWLFEQITKAPEYYLTRTELSILQSSTKRVLKFLAGDGGDIVELGSGAVGKIKVLLNTAFSIGTSRLRYVSVDICGDCIKNAIEELPQIYPDLEVLGLKADFNGNLGILSGGKKLVAFFGSTIGNFTEQGCMEFLARIRKIMNSNDRLLIGMDMVKSANIIEAAYNDRGGITGKFNLNVLSHINRELRADFKTDDFEHLAYFNSKEEQIEMHLRAKRDVSVYISDLFMKVRLRKGETISTEICRKFTPDGIVRLFAETGFCIENWFTDSRGWFSLVEVRPRIRFTPDSSPA